MQPHFFFRKKFELNVFVLLISLINFFNFLVNEKYQGSEKDKTQKKILFLCIVNFIKF